MSSALGALGCAVQSLTATEDVAAVGSVAVLISPSPAIVITSQPATAPKIKVRRETMPSKAVAEDNMAEDARMTTDPMAAVAVRRFRAGSGHGGRAKGYGGSKTENMLSHPVCSFSNGRAPAAQELSSRGLPKWTMVANQRFCLHTSSHLSGQRADRPERLDWIPERGDPQVPQCAERLRVPTRATGTH
jgi:hypothetical protein